MSHSENAADSLGLLFLLGSVGGGAGRVNDSQRVMAGAYLPQCDVCSREVMVPRCVDFSIGLPVVRGVPNSPS